MISDYGNIIPHINEKWKSKLMSKQKNMSVGGANYHTIIYTKHKGFTYNLMVFLRFKEILLLQLILQKKDIDIKDNML